MALLDGFGVAQPEEHFIIVNENAEQYMPIMGRVGARNGFHLPLFVSLTFSFLTF